MMGLSSLNYELFFDQKNNNSLPVLRRFIGSAKTLYEISFKRQDTAIDEMLRNE
jgi:hypothetical protein